MVHGGLTGGEPTLHRDLHEFVSGAAAAGLYVHLVTAGTTLDAEGLASLKQLGLRSVQVSVQDDRAAESDRIAGAQAFEAKLAFAAAVRALALPLTLNVVLHRHNLERVPELIALAAGGADRLELANTQYDGFAHLNRAALLRRAPSWRPPRSRWRARGPRKPDPRSCGCCPISSAAPHARLAAGAQHAAADAGRRALPCHAAVVAARPGVLALPRADLAACCATRPA